MRHFASAARVRLIGFVLAAASVPAFPSNLGFTVDLMAPSTACTGSKCPSDINLPEFGSTVGSNSFTYDVGLGTPQNYVATFTLDNTATKPLVCNEATGSPSSYTLGATDTTRFSPVFTNISGGLLEFDAGGASIVDISSLSISGIYSLFRSNTTSSQVACYPINQIGDSTPTLADTSSVGDRVFYNEFDAGHRSDEPWVSIQTINSPTGTALLGYVAQIHNASKAVNWHLSFGFDQSFDQSGNGGFVGHWYVLGASVPQPGPVPTIPTGAPNADFTSPYIISAGDIQSATNSVYVYVKEHSSSTMTSAWATLPSTFYPSTASAFAPPGTYAQRLDDKSGVAGVNNVPTFNIGSIVCANDPLASSCTITDQDGNPVPSAVTYKNQFNVGAVTIDPIAYVVDPAAATTLPGTTALTAPSNISCSDPNNILAGSIGTSNFAASTGPAGARAFGFSFNPAGALFVPGTATCTATFTANGLSTTQSFDITMQQLNVTHFAVTADATATAGSPASFTVTAKDGANNTVITYGGTVQFTSSDGAAVLPGSSTLVNGVGSFNGTLKTAGSQTFTATDTVSSTIHGTSNNVNVSAAAVASLLVNISSPVPAGSATVMHVNPIDQFGNAVSGYTGNLHFDSTDSAASLPADAAFTNGFYNNVIFNTVGNQTVMATDTGTSSITGTSNNVSVSLGP